MVNPQQFPCLYLFFKVQQDTRHRCALLLLERVQCTCANHSCANMSVCAKGATSTDWVGPKLMDVTKSQLCFHGLRFILEKYKVNTSMELCPPLHDDIYISRPVNMGWGRNVGYKRAPFQEKSRRYWKSRQDPKVKSMLLIHASFHVAFLVPFWFFHWLCCEASWRSSGSCVVALHCACGIALCGTR